MQQVVEPIDFSRKRSDVPQIISKNDKQDVTNELIQRDEKLKSEYLELKQKIEAILVYLSFFINDKTIEAEQVDINLI